MKFRRFALRGLVILAVTVALCMFFARTVQTITTPKIKFITANQGRFEQKITLDAKIYFPETEEITVPEAKLTPVTVVKTFVKEGHYVQSGDVIFTGTVPNYKEEQEKLTKEYNTKAKELTDLDISNRLKSKESKQNELYDAMITAQDELSDAVYQARAEARKVSIALAGDLGEWKQQLALLTDVPKAVTEAVAKAVRLSSAYETARTAFFAVYEDKKLRVKDDVFKYINDRNEAIKAMDKLQEEMIALEVRVSALSEVKAPRDGYIVKLEVSNGTTYDGAKAAYIMSAKDSQPVLRTKLPEKGKRIAEGTKVEIPVDEYTNERTTVEKTQTEADGSRYVYIALPEYMQGKSGSSAIRRAVSDDGVKANITYRAKETTTLLPPSAVRNEGQGKDYVYLIQQNDNGGLFNANSTTVVKTTVTVLERGDKAVSIQEDLSYQQVADGEDRALKDGQAVMAYVE